MSAWRERNGTASPIAGGGGGRQFRDVGVGAPSVSGGGVYRPTASGTGGAPAEESTTPPGVVSINPLNPLASEVNPIFQLFDGLRQATVGTNENRDAPGFVDKSWFGNIPVVGNIGRGIANVLGGAGDVAGAVVGGAVGLAERIPAEVLSPAMGGQRSPPGALDAAYAAIPEEFRREYDEAINKEHGLFGTGILDNDAHFKSVAVRKWAEDQQYEDPSLMPGAFTAPGSLANVVTNLIDALTVSSAVVAKGWSQLDSPTRGGMDRIDIIMAVGDGEAIFHEDKGLFGTGLLAGDPTTGLNDVEALVYAKLKNGDWTRDDAADFLATKGQAFGHSALENLAGAIVLDPLNLATLGSVTAAKVGAKGLVMAQRLSAAQAKLASVGRTMREAQDAVRVARVGGRGAENLSAARKALRLAEEQFEIAETSAKAFRAYHSSGTSIRRINVLARAVEGSEKVGEAFRYAGKLYGGLEGTNIGRAAKATRLLIDPMHAIDMRMPGVARALDIYAESVPRSVIDTLGVHHYKGILDDALKLDPTRAMHDQIALDLGVASANLARDGVIDLYRSGQMAANLGEDLMKTLPGDVIDVAIQSTKHRDLEKWLRYSALERVLIERWDDIAHRTLARQLEQVYHTRTAEEWMVAFKKMSKETKSLLKFASYGATNRALLNFTANITPAAAAALRFNPNRMVLIARGTLTRLGGEAILTKLSKPKLSLKKKLALIEEVQELYPALRYVSIDPANLERSVDRFIEHLKLTLDRLPMQLTADEFAALGDEGATLKGIIGEYSIGFRPEDRFLWGLEREAGTGLYRTVSGAWTDHVADGAVAYRPAAALRTNIAGNPIVDLPVVGGVVRAIDHIDSAARLMKTQVSSAMVHEAARKRFLARATMQFEEHGVTERVAQDWFERLTEYTREHPGYSGPRGMGGDELYRAIKEKNLIPQPLLNGERILNPDDVMRLVLEAYDGDLRYLGLTQKFSGRVKRYVFETTGSNLAGQIAEHAWPTLKFRYNPIFQLQEKIEPWVLNAQRGVSFATGVTMSDADRLTERLLQKMTDLSLVRQADLDQFEYGAAILLGKGLGKTASAQGTRLNAIQRMGESLTEVQGMKRLNMLRTFRKGLGKELRAGWEEANPGAWAKMKEAADLQAGRILDEDDFALQLVSENAFANDVFVRNVLDKSGKFTNRVAEWGNAVKTGAWHTPATLGELKALDLDHMAASLRIVNAAGEDITDLKTLRQALATDPHIMDNVIDGLTRLGADKDYIRRVQNSLDFSWTGFWKTATTRFALTDDESFRLQAMMAQAASLRGMSPVDFMSQVFSPVLIDGTEGVLGHLEGTVRVLREARAAGRKVRGREARVAETRTRLAGKEGVSTREDLVRQLSATFSAHLDPSAKRALLLEFTPEIRQAVMDGRIRMDLLDVQSLWDDMAENQLADRILGYMDGKLGTGAHQVLDDATRGVPAIRDAARKYLIDRGVTPHEGGRNYLLDDDLGQRSAQAYRDLPDLPYETTGRRPTITQINRASTELKPRPEGVDQRTYDAFQDFTIETRAQWDHMVKPKAKGGLGLKVIVSRKENPYPTAEALRADVAKGQLRVFGGASDHPLMTNEQNVMFRAVHDVFGRAADGFEYGARGDLNAAIRHAQMYSDTGRAAMLTETYGTSSWANYSDEVFDPPTLRPSELDPDDPIGSFEAAHPFRVPESQEQELMISDAFLRDPDVPAETKQMYRDLRAPKGAAYVQVTDEAGQTSTMIYRQVVGGGIRALPSDQQLIILQQLHDLLEELPDLRVHHIDVADLTGALGPGPDFKMMMKRTGKGKISRFGIGENIDGVAFGSDDGEAVILLDQRNFGASFYDKFDDSLRRDAEFRKQPFVWERAGPLPDGTQQWRRARRQTFMGVGHNVGIGAEHVIRHEAGHAFDLALRPRKWTATGWVHERRPVHSAYFDVVEALEQNVRFRGVLSEYAFKDSKEFAAELFSVATDPNLDWDEVAQVLRTAGVDEPEAMAKVMREGVEEYQRVLLEGGYWKPASGLSGEAEVLRGQTVGVVNRAIPGTVKPTRKAALLPQDVLDEFGGKFVGRGKHVESNPDVARTAQMFGKWSDAVVANGLLKGEHGVFSGLLHDIAGLPTGSAVPYNFTEGAAVNLATQAMVRKWDDAFRLQYFAQERTFFERSLNHPMFGMYPASYMWGKILPELVRFIAAEPVGIKTGGLMYSLMDLQAAIAIRREYDPHFDAKIEKLGHSQAINFLGYLLPTLPWDVAASAPGWMRSIAEQGLANLDRPYHEQRTPSLLHPATTTVQRLVPMLVTLPWAGRALDEVVGERTPEEQSRDVRDMNRAVKAAELQPTMQRIMQELQEALR